MRCCGNGGSDGGKAYGGGQSEVMTSSTELGGDSSECRVTLLEEEETQRGVLMRTNCKTVDL